MALPLRMPQAKRSISLRLDQDVVEWYREQGPGYQTRMNTVLRMYMQTRTGAARKAPSRRIRNNPKR
ncbi:MAG: BrnA antitoxin family protein [Chitinispirillaceae bacterium]|nr:BrnA antitoxin family protein [Chitinispirillaceae bacterium]